MSPPAPAAAPPAPLPRALRWALFAGLVLSQILIWGFDPLPSADLPEHAAQIALLRSLVDPSFPFAGQYELNLFTPYLLAYLLVALLALALPIGLAAKAVLAAGVAFWAWALLAFQRQAGADPWWSLAAFPLFFGLSFFWGFFNYLLAVPLVLLLAAAAHAHGREPSRRRGLRLAAVGILAFFAHGMACVFGLAIAGLLLVLLAPDWRRRWRGLLPLLPAAAAVLGWTLLGAEVGGKVAFIPLLRRLSLHRRLLGDWNDVAAAGWAAALLLVALAALIAERRFLAALPRRERWALRLPLLATLAYLALMPEYVAPLAFAGSRFMVFVPLFAGWWLRPARWRPLPPLLAAAALGWLLFLLPRFDANAREMAQLRPILDALPRHGKVLMIRLGFGESPFAIPMALHQPAWYTVEKGGQVDFSFAFFRTEMVRYREDRQPRIPEELSHLPWNYDLPAITGGYYDFWLVYAPGGGPEQRELAARWTAGHFEPAGANGPWWLYRKVPAANLR